MTVKTGPTFEEWYATYPRKVNPKDARKAWGQALKRGLTPATIEACTRLMVESEWKGRAKEYLPYPASFLRAQEPVSLTPAVIVNHGFTSEAHYCFCGGGHEWKHECDMWCSGRDKTCPEQIDAMRKKLGGKL